jgi:photosystem II stability/assembly factor-like uncharacterized protein
VLLRPHADRCEHHPRPNGTEFVRLTLAPNRNGYSSPLGGGLMRRSFLNSRAILGIVLTVGVSGATSFGMASTAGASTPKWTVSASFHAQINDLWAVACPSVSRCFALGKNTNDDTLVIDTTDRGKTWSAPRLVFGRGAIGDAITCPSVAVCYAVSDVPEGSGYMAGFVKTSNGGKSWQPLTLLSGSKGLFDIACPSVSTCYAAGNSQQKQAIVVVTTDGGANWTTHNLPSGIPTVFHLACPSATTCFVANDHRVFTTKDGGTNWAALKLPTRKNDLIGLACTTNRACLLSNRGEIDTTVDGGKNWQVHRIGSKYDSLTLSCPSETTCYATGQDDSGQASSQGVAFSTSDGGATWNPLMLPPGTGILSGLSCPMATTCYTTTQKISGNQLVGAVLVTSDSGTTWATQRVTAGIASIGAVDCVSSTTCYALSEGTNGEHLVMTRDAGTSWIVRALHSGYDLNAISCPSVSTCFVAAGGPAFDTAAISSTNGGIKWSTQTVPTGTGELVDISCPSTSVCFASGDNLDSVGDLIATTDGGSTWNTQTLPSGSQTLWAIDCPSVTTCYAAGEAVIQGARTDAAFTTTNGGASWNEQSLPGGVDVRALSCPSRTVCYGGGGFDSPIVTTTNGGTTWSAQSLPSNSGDLKGLFCPSVSVCYAVGDNYPGTRLPVEVGTILSTRDGGAKWAAEAPPAGPRELDAIACPSASSCYATGLAFGRVGGVILKRT